MFTLLCVIFYPMYTTTKKIKLKREQTGRIWMFEEILLGYGAYSGIMSLPVHLTSIFSNNSDKIPSDYVLFSFSFLVVSFYLISYIIIKIIPSKAEEYLKETYPEYTLVNTL